jgi:hypothetical protein
MLLTHRELETLRDALRTRGQRPSIVISGSRTSAELIEAMEIVEQWGPFVEAMYLMMAVDRRVLNIEREVLRGALAVISGDAVRTRHMEAMLDAAARNVAADGEDKRFQKVVESLREDRARAESAVIVAAAIAVADARVVPEEHALLERFCKELGIADARAQEILAGMKAEVAAK